MAKRKVKPSDVSMQVDWMIDAATDFAADLLEEVNDHNISLALRAVNAEEYDIACEFIKLEKEQAKAGELTPELNERRGELMRKLREAQREAAAD